GIVGALIGGFIFNAFGSAGATGLNLYSIIVAFVGAVVLLLILRALTGRRAV
ncbi:MAG: GlsB/YeaQ/YmgE family stress response membrane protein, partial [Candidatus Eremiobacteraeota bacterium]|nr:GlsB/YeaQ/YmgE family stress response membrane protein [Candidatus Eremiobacteraeota bacterium]